MTTRYTALLLALASLHCTRAHAPPAPSFTAVTPPVRHEAVATSPAPSANPAGFDDDVTERDVDLDGLVDRVRAIPAVERPGQVPLRFRDIPPALVAHRLPDGRYAVDDEVTRAALRALCPEAPAADFTLDASPTHDEVAPDLRARSLYLDAFCSLAWGRSLESVSTALREGLLAVDGGAPGITAPLLDAMVSSLRRVHFSFVLRPLTGDFPATGPASTTAPAAPATPAAPPDSAAVPSACRGVVVATERMRVRALREASRRPPPSTQSDLQTTLTDTRRCVALPEGTWTLRFTALDFGRSDDQGFDGPVELAFAPAPTPVPWRGMAMPDPWSQGTFRTLTYSIEDTFDGDGDGRSEAVLRTANWAHEESSTSLLSIYTARDGVVTAWPPAAAFGTILSLQDFDHDGRRDLVLPTRWSFVDGCGMGGVTHAGPTLLAHALAGGAFSTTDEVARAWVTRACERLSRPDDDLLEADREVWRVACARARGASPDRIVSALRAAHPGRPRFQPLGNDQEVCYPFQDLASLALIAPPFAPLRSGAPTDG